MLIFSWCIYEIGYIENDLVAEKFEVNPILPSTYLQYKQQINFWQFLAYSLILAILGIIFLIALTK